MKLSILSVALGTALFASVLANADPHTHQGQQGDGIAAVMAQLEHPPESSEHKAGVAQLRQLVEAGNPRAMVILGQRLEKGSGIDDFDYAISLYQRAIEAGYERAREKSAAALLSRGLREGPTTALGRQLLTAAAREYEVLAEQDNPDALWNLGYLLVSGYGRERDYPLGHAYIEQASKGGVAAASLWLANFYRANPGDGDPVQLRIEHLQRAAGQGSYLAKALLEDEGHPDASLAAEVSPTERAPLPEPVAAAESPTVESGGNVTTSTPPTTSEATTGFEAAPQTAAVTLPPPAPPHSYQELDRTRQELRIAQQRIAQLEAQVRSYELAHADADTLNRQGIQAVLANDYELAASSFRKASEMNHAGAIANLGTLHLNGTGVVRDGNQAVALFERAAELGNVTAAENLGRTYQYGIGVRQNRNRAIRWYRTAQEMGSSHASDVLRSMLDD